MPTSAKTIPDTRRNADDSITQRAPSEASPGSSAWTAPEVADRINASYAGSRS